MSLFVINFPNGTTDLDIEQRKEKTRAREKKRPASNTDINNRTKKHRVQCLMSDDDDNDQVGDHNTYNDIDEDDDEREFRAGIYPVSGTSLDSNMLTRACYQDYTEVREPLENQCLKTGKTNVANVENQRITLKNQCLPQTLKCHFRH